MTAIKISVRNLVEFIMRSGDLSVSSTGLKDSDAMQEGTRIHKKLQRRMGSGYQAEVPLSLETPVSYDGIDFVLTVEGRADGIFSDETGEVIDEIKGVYRDIHKMKEPVAVHRAQALCYAYIYAVLNELDGMGIRMTYCHIPTEEIRYFTEYLAFEALEKWYLSLLQEYAKWAAWQIRWQECRDDSIRKLEFPFPYRKGQGSLVKGVYQSIIRKKRLYIEAPTGVGKTISTVFPAVKSIGEGLTEKIFYLTAKTITRTVAQDTFQILEDCHTRLKAVTLTAKEKICILEKPVCNPATCERAKGHFDRVNDAVFDVLTHETMITREVISAYAEKHMVCPFEMSLDIATWCDVIIGDYNYVFDPTASLKRFFSVEKENDYVLLIDEAHNLVDRAREMYSASLVKEDFLAMKKITKVKNRKVTNALESCNRSLLELKRQCDSLQQYDSIEIESFVLRLMRLCTVLEEYFQTEEHGDIRQTTPLLPEEKEKLLNFYFEVRNFQSIYELTDEHYIIYGDYTTDGNFRLHLQCMDPSVNLDICLKKSRCSVFFSATLLPIHYYREQLAGREEDYAVYAPSPFQAANRLLMIGRGVSTKYTLRSPAMYQKIAQYILKFVRAKLGNYMIFFPSYQMLETIQMYLTETDDSLVVYAQKTSMSEEEREEFLSHFQDTPSHTTLGLCVMGGIFGEGIDLKDSRLIGAVIVGTGLPMVCTENELFKEYFDKEKGTGFSYAYQYPGMNKVLQAAGRVIRTTSDVGAILLLDDRFLQSSYQKLFPREWFPYDVVTLDSMPEYLARFWDRHS
ncbi:MAG: ATP-dependent DNA helicase [Butyribacter sp.]|nr:ATP-dependent DNA helicase [bacterium]MDY3854009.1 ATP-dependent DNA helicase [Butyribacter sp.]